MRRVRMISPIRWRPGGPVGRRGRTSAPAARSPRAGSPWPAPRARTSRTYPDARSAPPADGAAKGRGTGRWSARSTPCARRSRITARISSSVSPSPTISPDLVGIRGAVSSVGRKQFKRMRVIAARDARACTGAARFPCCGSSRPAAPRPAPRARAPGARGSPAPAPRWRCAATARAPRGCSRRNAARRRPCRSSRSTLVMTT